MFNFDKNKINSIIQNLHKGRVLVIGDFAIDEMVYGQTHRLSREAPVLILRHNHTKIILGAASNAAHNISALNSGKVSAVGVYGEDYHGPVLIDAMKSAGIDVSGMITDASRPTTTKTRISGMATQSVTQQIVRIDREMTTEVTGETEQEIIDIINERTPHCDAVLLSDYGIGMMTPAVIKAAIDAANRYGKFVAVDAQKDLTRFQNVTVLTPNQPDAEKTLGYELTSFDALMRGGKELLERTNAEMVLITRGGEGMSLFEKNGNVSHIPVFNKTDVFDVTGAGDTVVASFILALCAGATGTEAGIIGNLAASIVIRHFGCAITSREELQDNLNRLNTENYTIKA